MLKYYKDTIPEVRTFYTSFKEETAKTQKEAEQNEKEFIQKKSECIRKLENHRQIAIQYAEKYITKIMDDLNKLDLSKLDRDAKLKFDLIMEKIKVIQEQLKTSKNYAETQELLKLVCKELNVIKEVVLSITPQMTEQILDQDLLVLQKMSIKSEKILLKEDMIIESSVSAIRIQEQEGTSLDSIQSQSLASNAAGIFRDKPILAENEVFSPSPIDKDRREKLNGFKIAMSLGRHEHQADPQHPIEIMRKSVESLEIRLSSEFEDFSKLKQLKHLLDNIQLGLGQVDKSKIIEICTLAVELDEENDTFNLSSKELADLFDVTNTPK